MGVKRIVDTQFWDDDKVVDVFSPEDKLFMLYLMTNPHTTQLGIYPINKKVMAFELGYSIDTISILLERFENKYKIIKYSNETKEIAIKNYLKYSIVKGGKPVEDLLIKEIASIKDKKLLTYVYDNIKDFDNLNITVKSILNKLNEYDNEKDNDNDNDVSYHDTYHDTSKQIIDYLNLRIGSNYKYSTKKTQDLIKARLNEGFTLEDFKIVIDKMCVEWINSDMQKYLRPETLFGNKFESYLNREVRLTTKNMSISSEEISSIFG